MSLAPEPWLFGRRNDLVLFGGSAALCLFVLGLGHLTARTDDGLPPWLFLGVLVAVDLAHLWATGWRVLADGSEARTRFALYLGVPLAAWAVGVALYSVSILLFWRVLAYLAVFHVVRQQYGWVALYRRKNGEGDEGRRLDAAVIYGAMLTPLVFWHAHLPRRFEWFFQGEFLSGLPPAASTAAFCAFGAVFAAWSANEVRRARRGERTSWGKVLIVVTTTATWFLGTIILDSDWAFAVTNLFSHGIPYLALVWFTSRQIADERGAWGGSPSLADRAGRSIALFAAPLVVFALLQKWGWESFVWYDPLLPRPGSAVFLALLVPLLAVPQATHYVLDGFLWKMKPRNRHALGTMGLMASGRPAGSSGSSRTTGRAALPA